MSHVKARAQSAAKDRVRFYGPGSPRSGETTQDFKIRRMCADFPPAGRCRLMATGNILVADDDTAIRTVLSQALSRAGYDVRTTGNAATLWRWVQSGEGDLVITDVVMPDENAFEILPKMKKLRPNLPIIVISAQNTFMTAIKASERGAYDYLPKPFDLRELVSIVGRAMSEPKNRVRAAPNADLEGMMPLVGRSP